MVLCDYCTQCQAKLHNDAPKSLSQFDGFNPHNVTFGAQADISNLCTFNWYDLCYYKEKLGFRFTFQKEVLCRILGPTKTDGNKMVQTVLNANDQVVSRCIYRRLTIVEITSQLL